MQNQSKKDLRENILEDLKKWHADLGISDFPKRFGISTNEKKFREISFRLKENAEQNSATVDDIIVAKQPVFGLNHTIVGYNITYRVWLPTNEGKFPGTLTIRFSLFKSVVAVVKINGYYVAVKNDNIPLQNKTIGLPRMYGVSSSDDLNTLAKLLITKEFSFVLDKMNSLIVRQLGDTVFQDPTTKKEETIQLFIDLKLKVETKTKEDLDELFDIKNKDLLLYKIYDENELQELIKQRFSPKESDKVVEIPSLEFRDQYSLLTLITYFNSLK